jgi:hypothetical protein
MKTVSLACVLLVVVMSTGYPMAGLAKSKQPARQLVDASSKKKPSWAVACDKTGRAIRKSAPDEYAVAVKLADVYDLSFAENQAPATAYIQLARELGVVGKEDNVIATFWPPGKMIYWEKWEDASGDVVEYTYNVYLVSIISSKLFPLGITTVPSK